MCKAVGELILHNMMSADGQVPRKRGTCLTACKATILQATFMVRADACLEA